MPVIRKSARLLGLAIRKVFVKPRESVLSARLALWVVLVSVLARVTTLPRTQRISSRRVKPNARADRDRVAVHIAATLDALLALDVFVFRPICWKRALVLQRFLALDGIDTRIVFGVQKPGGTPLQGHAWLERDGQPFLENTTGAYVVTFTLPQDRGSAALPRH